MSTAPASKGQATRDAIVQRALELAMRQGLEGLTIGSVAEAMRMSKSGVFAHFGSREDLQLAVLDQATRNFSDQVFAPALRQRRGLARLRAIMANIARFHLESSAQGGCVVLSATHEFDDRPGPIRERVFSYQRQLRNELQRAIAMAVEAGELPPHTEVEQLGFELFGMMLGTHHDVRVLGDARVVERALRSYDRLIESWQRAS